LEIQLQLIAQSASLICEEKENGGSQMADRKQFVGVTAPDPDLVRILEESKGNEVSEAELREQRISFAFGNGLASDSITKDSVRKASEHIRLLK